MVRMFRDKFSSSTSRLRWLHEMEPCRLDPSLSRFFLKVATHPFVRSRAYREGSGRLDCGEDNTKKGLVRLLTLPHYFR